MNDYTFTRMKKLTAALYAVLLLASSLSAQDGDFLQENEPYNLPQVRINDHSASLQRGLFPEYYRTHSAESDMRWVIKNDSALIDFWETMGDSILVTLETLGGIAWQEESFDLYFLRWYPSVGEADPLIIPLGGIRGAALTEAAPTSSRMRFNIIFQLSRRLLAQVDRSWHDSPSAHDGLNPLAEHALMRPGPYRRDNLALLLAMVTSQSVIGLDSTYAAYHSAFWQKRLPGKQIFEKYILSDWILTPNHTLYDWVLEEPASSSLTRASRPPRRPKRSVIAGRPMTFIEDLPIKGQFGFSVKRNAANRLIVDKIDPMRAGFANGLREDDIILSVNGRRVRSHKQMVERIFETFFDDGATLTVIRGEESFSLSFRPIMVAVEEYDDLFWEEYEESLLEQGNEDSLLDSVDEDDRAEPTPE